MTRRRHVTTATAGAVALVALVGTASAATPGTVRVDAYRLALADPSVPRARETIGERLAEARTVDAAANALTQLGATEFLGTDAKPVDARGEASLEIGRKERPYLADLPRDGGRPPLTTLTTGRTIALRQVEIAGAPSLSYVVADTEVEAGPQIEGGRGRLQAPRVDEQRTAGAFATGDGRVRGIVTQDATRRDGYVVYLVTTGEVGTDGP